MLLATIAAAAMGDYADNPVFTGVASLNHESDHDANDFGAVLGDRGTGDDRDASALSRDARLVITLPTMPVSTREARGMHSNASVATGKATIAKGSSVPLLAGGSAVSACENEGDSDLCKGSYGGLSPAALAGIVIGCILGTALLGTAIALFVVIYRRSRVGRGVEQEQNRATTLRQLIGGRNTRGADLEAGQGIELTHV
ncbi:Uu.00g108840.m01.CDS01 [Anthostomella pinea]|uniref:Uu.00g108840.m01.CDS01 n=1 Tax=Anthostomella pinea TaxID=933095 RepID=A0AAI8VEN7_9PEZI|nr:Uu.00g108840.m01.CDS01 [Anthostomella pinea]